MRAACRGDAPRTSKTCGETARLHGLYTSTKRGRRDSSPRNVTSRAAGVRRDSSVDARLSTPSKHGHPIEPRGVQRVAEEGHGVGPGGRARPDAARHGVDGQADLCGKNLQQVVAEGERGVGAPARELFSQPRSDSWIQEPVVPEALASSPRNIHVAAAASPRPVSAEYPRRGRGVAAIVEEDPRGRDTGRPREQSRGPRGRRGARIRSRPRRLIQGRTRASRKRDRATAPVEHTLPRPACRRGART